MTEDDRLLEGVARGDLAAVAGALALGASPDAARRYQSSWDREVVEGAEPALLLAVKSGSLELIRLLIDAGADVNARDGLADEDGLTAAIAAGDAGAARLLVDAGATVRPAALLRACQMEREDLAELCLAGIQPGEARILDRLAMLGHTGMLRWLVARGTSIAEEGPQALCEAANAGQAEAAAYLLQQGVPVESRVSYGWTALHLAAYNGNPETVRVLLAAGADPAADDGTGKTPLDWASEAGKADNVALLQQAARR